MKTQFAEYYKPSNDQFKTLWESCIFCFDANVLLNIYGYSEGTREQFLGLIERLGGRVAMPYQFALEYQRNRAHAIVEQARNYAKVERTLKDLYEQEFKPRTKHPFLSRKALNSFEIIREELSKSRKQHEGLLSNDIYFDRITKLIINVSAKPSDEDVSKLYTKAKPRYAAKIPPGYADSKDKGEPGCYGDYIGWMQIIDIAKSESKPVILVTDDAKEDWWQIQGDRTIGPRPELLAEFRAECKVEFYMYSSENFMRLAGKYLSQEVQESAIEEVAARLQRQPHDSDQLKPESKILSDGDQPQKPFVPSDYSQVDEPKASAIVAEEDKATENAN